MEIYGKIKKLITRGEFLISLSENSKIKDVPGINKFRKKVKKELAFLEEVLLKTNPSNVFIKCTNLQHLEALINQAINEVDCVSLLKVFKYNISESPKKLIVDIVSHNGSRWNKISARNPRALTLNSSENSVFGVRSVIDQANDFLKCAIEHPHLFQTPEVVFHFASGIEISLAYNLRNLGVCVSGRLLNNESGLVAMESEISSSKIFKSERNAVNLDVSAMMAYVSSSTNGGCYAVLDSPILADQAKREKTHSVKQMLDNIFKGKELLCCKTAEDDFRSILRTIAGVQEMKRAEEFLKRVTVVLDSPSDRALSLEKKGKIKQRSIIIFGTGDKLKIPTITANAGFVRAAQHQGVNFVVVVHESRALTEAKERSRYIS